MVKMINHAGGEGVEFGRLTSNPLQQDGSPDPSDAPMHGVDTQTATLRQRIQIEPRRTRGQHFLRLLRSLTPIGA